MARPLRLEFAGALYHVTARGDRQEPIFLTDHDRRKFLDLLGKEVAQQWWQCYAYCLMTNHYHLLIETPQPNLVRGMQRLNGVYTLAFNRRRKQSGHVFQGRYKAILVDKEHYLLNQNRGQALISRQSETTPTAPRLLPVALGIGKRRHSTVHTESVVLAYFMVPNHFHLAIWQCGERINLV